MINNDIIRRVRYTLNFNDKKMMKISSLLGPEVSREKLSQWLKRDEDPDFLICSDLELSRFLDGLIIEKRGAREGEQPKPLEKLTNNIIFRKLMIAFSLKSEDVIEVLALSELKVSKHELSAFFRKPSHHNYRACKDQILRRFMSGLQKKFRVEPELKDK